MTPAMLAQFVHDIRAGEWRTSKIAPIVLAGNIRSMWQCHRERIRAHGQARK
jgi:hypothetical protein